MILYKNVLGKKFVLYIVETSLYTFAESMFTTMQKRSLIFKTHLAIFNMQMQKKKSPFYENVLDLTLFSQDLELFFLVFFLRTYFLQDFNSCDLYFLRLYWQSLILGEKNSQESKTQNFFPVTFCPRTSENWDFLPKFLFPGFFPQKSYFFQ